MEIAKEDLKLPDISKEKLAFVLHNVFTEEECNKYIIDSEKRGYELAKCNVGSGRQIYASHVRNSSRNSWVSKEEAGRILGRIKKFLPAEWKGRKLVEIDERLIFLRYDPGEYFKPHFDGSSVKDNRTKSYLSIQIYLNQGFEGGSTLFLDSYSGKKVGGVEMIPKTGSVLIFQHDILHEGSELIKGRKYAIRTNVMYEAL